jgi:hypothetical protein
MSERHGEPFLPQWSWSSVVPEWQPELLRGRVWSNALVAEIGEC